jgi:hypothetical protein
MILKTISKYDLHKSYLLYRKQLPSAASITIAHLYNSNINSSKPFYDTVIYEITLQCTTPDIEICHLIILTRSTYNIIINSDLNDS